MQRNKKLVTLLVAMVLILSLSLVPIASQVAPAQADVDWTKYSGDVTLGDEQHVIDAWVLEDSGTYRMWYTHAQEDLNFNDVVGDIRGLSLDNIIDDIVNKDLDQLLDDMVDLVADLDTADAILDGARTAIGYATSTDGKTWIVQKSEALAGSGNGVWNSIGAPCVIKDDAAAASERYKMWYTRSKSVLTQQILEDILTDLGGSAEERRDAILDLKNSTTTVIGYATSNDGSSWTVQNNEVLAGDSYDLWNVVGAPCVIKDDDAAASERYKMWYTRSKTDITQADIDDILSHTDTFDAGELLGLLDGTTAVIGYATSSDGISWTVQDNEVLSGGGGVWDSVADPSVILSGGTYEMWYTNSTSDLNENSLRSLADEIVALDMDVLWDSLVAQNWADFLTDLFSHDIDDIENLLDNSGTTIGYATSSDGETWTVQDASDLTGSSNGLWSSVAAPSVVKDGTTYHMWYTSGIAALTWQNLIDLIFSGDPPIEYASTRRRTNG